MVVIGLTGGIASGKTTAAGFLEAAGAPVVRADRLARMVVAPGTPGLAEIARAWPAVIAPNGELDRKELAAVIFSDSDARRRLEAITHPRIHRRMRRWLEARRRAGAPAAVCDIPLLFEVGYDREAGFLDRIWVVSVDPETQLRRLMQRDGLARAEAQLRVDAQWPLARKRERADLVLDNSGTPAELRAGVLGAWSALVGGSPTP